MHLSWVDQNGKIRHIRLFLAFFVFLMTLRVFLFWSVHAPKLSLHVLISVLIGLALIQSLLMIQRMFTECIDELRRCAFILIPEMRIEVSSHQEKRCPDTSCESIPLSIHALKVIRI